MALDTGSVMTLRLVDPAAERVIAPASGDFEKVGDYLRAVRHYRSLQLADLATLTRISKTYLQAIEEGDLSALPSRPFAIGYVRSYAQAMDLDGEAVAARYKRETPEFAEPLRNPIGVQHERRRNNPLIFAVIGLIVSGVVLWNVVQRGLNSDDAAASAPPLPVAAEPPPEAAAKGPIALGAATPPPADQTLPVPYVTPGMSGPSTAASVGSVAPTAPVAGPVLTLPPVFAPKGAVYGAPDSSPAVVLQARKPASLIMRGASGAVYFARQLAAGEAYRAPIGAGLTADVAEPDAFGVYVGGHASVSLPGPQTPIDKLNVPAPAGASAAAPVAVKTPAAR